MMKKHIAVALLLLAVLGVWAVKPLLKSKCDFYSQFDFSSRSACEEAQRTVAVKAGVDNPMPSADATAKVVPVEKITQENVRQAPAMQPGVAPQPVEPTAEAAVVQPSASSTQASSLSAQTAEPPANIDVPDYSSLAGKSPQDVILDRMLERELVDKVSLDDMNLLDINLAVSSLTELKDGYVFGNGCAAHQCGAEEAAFAVNVKDGSFYVAFLHGGKLKMGGGVENVEQLPPPLQAWVADHQQERRRK